MLVSVVHKFRKINLTGINKGFSFSFKQDYLFDADALNLTYMAMPRKPETYFDFLIQEKSRRNLNYDIFNKAFCIGNNL